MIRAESYRRAYNTAVQKGMELRDRLLQLNREATAVAHDSGDRRKIEQGNYSDVDSALNNGLTKMWRVLDKATPLKAQFLAAKRQIQLYRTLMTNEAIAADPANACLKRSSHSPTPMRGQRDLLHLPVLLLVEIHFPVLRSFLDKGVF